MAQLNLGEKITVKGPAGNIASVVVGVGFDVADLQRMLATGELTLVEPAKPEPAAVKKPLVKKQEPGPA